VTNIYQFLVDNDIEYERYDHPPVFTCEEADRLVPRLEATKTKNLFLRDRKGRRHFLVVVGFEKVVNLKAMASLLGVNRLAIASPERLSRLLGVMPGAVSILAVVNDKTKGVEVVVDEELWMAHSIQCHPLVNTSTLVISRDSISRVLSTTGHQIQILKIPER
jgi:Ala-tRNA(Pro) deacylase